MDWLLPSFTIVSGAIGAVLGRRQALEHLQARLDELTQQHEAARELALAHQAGKLMREMLSRTELGHQWADAQALHRQRIAEFELHRVRRHGDEEAGLRRSLARRSSTFSGLLGEPAQSPILDSVDLDPRDEFDIREPRAWETHASPIDPETTTIGSWEFKHVPTGSRLRVLRVEECHWQAWGIQGWVVYPQNLPKNCKWTDVELEPFFEEIRTYIPYGRLDSYDYYTAIETGKHWLIHKLTGTWPPRTAPKTDFMDIYHAMWPNCEE